MGLSVVNNINIVNSYDNVCILGVDFGSVRQTDISVLSRDLPKTDMAGLSQ